jgi:hypothetical protein
VPLGGLELCNYEAQFIIETYIPNPVTRLGMENRKD